MTKVPAITNTIRDNLLDRAAREINWFEHFDQLHIREDSPIFVSKKNLIEQQNELLERLLRFGRNNDEDLVHRSGLLGDQYIPGIALLQRIREMENKRVEELHREAIEDCKQIAFSKGYDSIREWVVDKIPATNFNNSVVFANVENLPTMQQNMLDALHYCDGELKTVDDVKYKEQGAAYYIATGKLAKMLSQKIKASDTLSGATQTTQSAKLYEFPKRGNAKQ